jgi:hypothetical protein
MSAARLHPPALAVRGTLHRIRSFSLGAKRRGNLGHALRAQFDRDCFASLAMTTKVDATSGPRAFTRLRWTMTMMVGS